MMTTLLTAAELTGRARSHITQVDSPRFAAQAPVAAAFMRMRAAAASDGIDLLPFSSYRDFHTQCRIWNFKFTGRKPLYDQAGELRPEVTMTPDERIDCILNWSAVPGASRHHWGSEIDVVDGAVMPPGYEPRLLPQEVAPGGLFERLHRWLDVHAHAFGFFRPYDRYRGGMFAEPWHLSHAQTALEAQRALSVDMVREAVTGAGLEGLEWLLPRLPHIFEHHVLNVAQAPGAACGGQSAG